MSVKAKFKVDTLQLSQYHRQIDPTKGWGKDNLENVIMTTINASPVSYDANNNENSAFWSASPQGSLQLGCINPEASAQFELGTEFYITFEKA